MALQPYFDIAFTPSVIALQERAGSREHYAFAPSDAHEESPHRLSDDEVGMIQTRDSIYMATTSETGWPYVQHRGGEPGFVHVIDESTIGWVERSGNRQYVGTGNLTEDGRVALILMDYPTRTRLKVWGRATHHPEPSAALLRQLGAEAVFVGSGIFKAKKPEAMARAIVQATTHFDDFERLATLSENLGDAMPGLDVATMPDEEKLQNRGW